MRPAPIPCAIPNTSGRVLRYETAPTRTGALIERSRERRLVEVLDDVVDGVALDRLAPGVADQPAQIRHRQPDRGLRPGHVDDLLFLDGAVDVVRAHRQPD